MTNSYITYISFSVPESVLTNEEISRDHPEWSIDKIANKTGITKRHIADVNETSLDLGFKSGEKLFQETGFMRDEIDYLIFCTQSPDYFIPTSACILQNKLRLRKSVGAIDVNQGCSGYVYCLSIAKGLIAGNIAKNVLVITAETYSKIIHKEDKNNKTIFGDASTATIVSNKSDSGLGLRIGNFSNFTDGSGYDKLILRNKGFRSLNKIGSDIKDDYLFMDGRAIFNFTSKFVPRIVKDTLNKNNLSQSDIDLFVFHQANKFMVDVVRKRCEIDKSRFFTHYEYGNTVSNTIPIALKKYFDMNKEFVPRYIMLTGYGVGLSMSSVIIENNG